MATANIRTSSVINIQQIEADISAARRSHAAAKDSATEAAANAYLVWRDTQSKQSTDESRTWLIKEIDDRNKIIEDHNTEERDLEKRVKQFKEGTLKSDDWIFKVAKDKIEQKEIDAEKTKLTALFPIEPDEWAKRRLVKIDAKAGASEFTRIVKYVFQFDRSNQADSVYRYCLILEWIDSQFRTKKIAAASDIIAAISAIGLEEIMEIQKAARIGYSDLAERKKITQEAAQKQAKQVIKTAPSKASVLMDVKNAYGGFTMVLCRVTGAEIELIKDVGFKDDEWGRIFLRVEDDTLMPTIANTEFVASLLELSEIVEDGKETDQIIGGTESGQKIETKKVVTFRTNANNIPEVVISARHADSSVVIHATPKDQHSLGTPKQTLFMFSDARKNLYQEIKSPEYRRFIDVQPTDEPLKADGTRASSPLGWVLGNKALIDANFPNAYQTYFWSDGSNSASRPLDIDNFSPMYRGKITAEDMALLFQLKLEEWGREVSPNKNTKIMNMSFGNDKMKFSAKGAEAYEIDLVDGKGSACTLSFRPRELHDLLEFVVTRSTGEFLLAADEGGLMEIGWIDPYGSYRVYLPTVTQDGKLHSRRVAPMKIGLQQEAA